MNGFKHTTLLVYLLVELGNLFASALPYDYEPFLENSVYYSHLFLLRFLIHPEVDVGSEEGELGAGGEDQQERLHSPAEVNALHPVEQQEELSEVLKM